MMSLWSMGTTGVVTVNELTKKADELLFAKLLMKYAPCLALLSAFMKYAGILLHCVNIF